MEKESYKRIEATHQGCSHPGCTHEGCNHPGCESSGVLKRLEA